MNRMKPTMGDKTLETIDTICLNFSPFPPHPQVMLPFMQPSTLWPVLSQHQLFGGGGEGRAILGIHVVREGHIMLHLIF